MNIFKRPMFYAAVVCCWSAALSLYVVSLSIWLIVVAVVFLLFVSIFYKKYKYIIVMLAIVLFTISLFAEFMKIKNLKQHNAEKISGSFLVTDEPIDHGIFNSVTLKEVDCDTIPNNVKLFAYDYEKSELKIGDIVDVTFKLGIVDKYSRYRLSNYGSSIYATANIINLKQTGKYNPFYKMAGNIRSYVKDTELSHFKGDVAGLLVALTTGDKTLLSDEFAANIKTTGISHVVVVSGMHLTIIMIAIFWCLDNLFYNKFIRFISSIAFVILISTVCGFTMSITRAVVMFLIAGLAPIFNRESDSLSSLLTAVTVVLISAPFAIFNISFQLSVLSTLAIIWVVPFYSKLIKEKFNIKSKIIKILVDTFLCSIFAIIFTLPVTIKTFSYVSIVSPITNLIISYPVMIALVFNILSLVISVIPLVEILSTATFFVAGICSRFMVFAVNLIAKLPITVAVLPKNAFWWAIVVILIVIGFMYIYEFKKKRSDLSANSI